MRWKNLPHVAVGGSSLVGTSDMMHNAPKTAKPCALVNVASTAHNNDMMKNHILALCWNKMIERNTHMRTPKFSSAVKAQNALSKFSIEKRCQLAAARSMYPNRPPKCFM